MALILLVNLVFKVIKILIFIRIIMSWIIPYSRNEFIDLVHNLTEPILKPFRVLIPIGRTNIDFSPILALFALDFARKLIFNLLMML